MRNIFLGAVLALGAGAGAGVGVLGCGASQAKPQSAASSAPAPASSAPAPAAPHAGGQKCPMMGMAGTSVVASDTSDGVALTFTTTGDPAELRARVHRMAEMHNRMAEMHGEGPMQGGTQGGGPMQGGMQHGGPMQGGGSMQGGMQHGGHMQGGMGMHMVPSRASVEDLPDGARLVLVPIDPSQLQALRAQAREHAAMMSKGECRMMGPTPQAQPTDEHSQHRHPAGE